MDYTNLIALCEGRKVWIQTHNFPDPDAIASAFGLAEFLAHFGIDTQLCYDGSIDKLSSTKMLKLLGAKMKAINEIPDMTEKHRIILVDCQKNGGNTTDMIGEEVAVIDHHPTFQEEQYDYADLRITGACASLIAEYFMVAGITPSKKAATGLVYGMRMDTMQFSRGVTAFDIDMYQYLFPYLDQRLLHRLETNNMEFQDLRGYAAAIEHIEVYGKVAFSYLDFTCPDALVGILSDFLLSLVEVEVVVLYAKRKKGVKFSVRSERSDIHAGTLCSQALSVWGNGGGHAAMAGGFVPADKLPADPGLRFEMVRTRFIDTMQQLYPDEVKSVQR